MDDLRKSHELVLSAIEQLDRLIQRAKASGLKTMDCVAVLDAQADYLRERGEQ